MAAKSLRGLPAMVIFSACAFLLATSCGREDVRQESPRQQDTPAIPADPEPAAPKKPAVLPPGFEDGFIIPDADKDQYGNPVVTHEGSKADPATGYSFEIWFKQPRMEFVLIPAGEFMMGSPDSEAGRSSTEGPVHRVTFAKPFFMAKYEVTQEQWEAVMGDNPSDFKNAGKDAPVEELTWDDCQAFCKKTGLSLQTEAQWEYACRARTTTPFHFGATITPDQVNYDGNSPYGNAQKGKVRQITVKVGSFPSNAWGLYDMHGNVWEWCEDNWHGNYRGAPTDGTAWLGGSPLRVLRGGSLGHDARYCRSASRDWIDPAYNLNTLGFRPVRPLQ